MLLEYGAARGAQLVTVIDVRRHDERSLYGSIRGSAHLPVEQLPKSLLSSADDWLRAHHFRKPGSDEVVIVYSRAQERANLAKQLFNDAGWHRCLVLEDGVVGWRGSGGTHNLAVDVRGYEAYAEGELPPEPFPPATPAPIDRPEAEAELVQKNVLPP